jgi:hypothetical protein
LLLSPTTGRATAAARLALGLAACGSPGGEVGPDAQTFPVGFLGDAGSPPDFEFLALGPGDVVGRVQDGDDVSMLLPPQGGRVVFAGVRATNVEGSELQLTEALRDLATRQVRFDSRTINLVPTGDGWGVSASLDAPASNAIGSFSNIPVCPNEWSATDVYDHAYSLEVTIHDRKGRMLTKAIRVTPRCDEPENLAECLCICMGGYVLGQACAAGDGGPGDASVLDAAGDR